MPVGAVAVKLENLTNDILFKTEEYSIVDNENVMKVVKFNMTGNKRNQIFH